MFDHTGKPTGNPHQTLFPRASTLGHFQRIRQQNAVRATHLNTAPPPPPTPEPATPSGRKTVDTRFPPHPGVS